MRESRDNKSQNTEQTDWQMVPSTGCVVSGTTRSCWVRRAAREVAACTSGAQ